MNRACIAVAALMLVAWGCASHDQTGVAAHSIHDDQLSPVIRSVVRIESITDQFRASAVSLGENRFITNRHCLPAAAVSADAGSMSAAVVEAAESVNPLFELLLNGASVVAQLEDRGASRVAEDDWALFRVIGPDLQIPAIPRDDAHQFRFGDTVVLVGFWGDFVGPGPYTVSGRVTKLPLPWLYVPSEIVPLDTSHDEVYEGMSGGAAVVWDEGRGEYVLVGVYRGMRQWPIIGGLKCGVQAVRRLPASAT